MLAVAGRSCHQVEIVLVGLFEVVELFEWSVEMCRRRVDWWQVEGLVETSATHVL